MIFHEYYNWEELRRLNNQKYSFFGIPKFVVTSKNRITADFDAKNFLTLQESTFLGNQNQHDLNTVSTDSA